MRRRYAVRSSSIVLLAGRLGGMAALLGMALGAAQAPAEQPAIQAAKNNAELASPAFTRVHRWLHEKMLPAVDPETGLLRDTERAWNYQDSAADCFPFMTWAAYFTDRPVFEEVMLKMLQAEIRLCSHYDDVIPVNFPLDRKEKLTNQPYDFSSPGARGARQPPVTFCASEYMKDGLVPIVEAVGPGPFLDRMKAICDALWKRADVDSPAGKLVTDHLEANGDQLQVLTRLYGYTGDRRYLEQARRIVDRYLADPDFVPPRLDDHGCEFITGIGLFQGVLSVTDSEAEKRYRPRIKAMLDEILDRGLNEDGLMLLRIANAPGPHDGPITDNWGYNYVAHVCYDLVTGESNYREAIRKPLVNIAKPKYHLYKWEGDWIDGPADAIEGALYLLACDPVPEGIRWADREMRDDILPRLATGTNKFFCNAARTTLLYALSKTQNIHTPQWRADLRLGAAREGEGVRVFIAAQQTWEGPLVFDIPRHREWLHFTRDWPRINYLPEYFTVEPAQDYQVRVGDAEPRIMKGAELRKGLPVRLAGGQELMIRVTPAP